MHRGFRQGEDLEKGAVKGNQVFVYQLVTDNNIVIYRKTEQRADLVIVVIGKSLAVGYKHQKKYRSNSFRVRLVKNPLLRKRWPIQAKLPSIFLIRLQTRGFLLTMCSSRMSK